MTIAATWNTGSGSWFTAVNWDEPDPNPPGGTLHYVPGADNDVSIPNNNGSTPFAVTYAGTSTINTLVGSGDGLLDIASGSLTILNGGAANGMTVNLAGTATLAVGAGTFVTTGGSYAGTISGGGTLHFRGGTYDLNAGLSMTIANWIIGVTSNGFGAVADLNTDLTYAGNFMLADFGGNAATLALNGHTLTLSGEAILDGSLIGPGTMLVEGTAAVGSGGFATPEIVGGAVLQLAAGSSAVQHANASLGDSTSTGTIQIDSGASYTIDADASITKGAAGSSLITNAGTLAVMGAGTEATIDAVLMSTGAIQVGGGAQLRLLGTPTIGGSVSGAGTLIFGFGADATLNTANVTVAALQLNGGNGGAALRLGTNLSYAGQLSFANQFDLLDLNGRILTLSGTGNALLGNAVDGGGTLRVTGSATIGGNIDLGDTTAMTFRNSGTITQTGTIFLRGTILNDTGRHWTIATAGNINDAGATITNNGSFTDNAAGLSSIFGSFTNTGALLVGAGATLALNGTKTLGGTLSGAGTLLIGSGTAALNTAVETAGFTIGNAGTTTLGLDLTYDGVFALDQFATLALDGHVLTLNGSTSFGGTIAGSAGTDRLVVNGTNADLSFLQLTSWTAGIDTVALSGTSGSDSLIGSHQADSVNGANGADSLNGLGGDDTLDGGKGADSLTGGAGNDLLVVDNAGDQASEAPAGGHDTVQAEVNWTLGAEFEDLVLTGKAKSGTGNALDNAITGTAGKNSLSGEAGSDTLDGGDGADLLDGGAGADSMVGGGGNDAYIVDDAGDVVVEQPLGGIDEVRTSLASYTLGTEFENLSLLAGAANGTGNAQNNTIGGNNAANLLSGLDGKDLLLGGGGDDTLLGGAGGDTLEGGGGRDSLDGGANGDLFRWLAPSQGRDSIAGFSAAQDDLAFSADGFGGGLTAGVALTAAQFEANATGTASTAAVRFVLDTVTGVLSYDADGSGAGTAAIIATFAGAPPALTTADFIIVA